MTSFRFLITTLVLVTLAISAYLLLSDDDVSKQKDLSESAPEAFETAEPNAPTATKIIAPAENTDPLAEDEALFTMAGQIEDIASAYSETAKYPRGSQPIQNPEQLVVFEDFEENATSFGLDSDYYGEVQLSVATKQYQHFSGDDIEIRVALSSVPSSESVNAIAQLSTIDAEVLAELELVPRFTQGWELYGVIDADKVEALAAPPELQVSAIVQVGVERFFSSAALRYVMPSATVLALDNVNPNAEYLDIPLTLDVHKAGYFFLSAVLFDASGKRPLIQLQEEARLASGEQDITLKAHIQALKRQGDEGPYTLKHFELRRGAEEGEVLDQAGNSKIKEAFVEGFSFERYEDKVFDDPLAKEREAFLRRLSNTIGG